MGAHRITLRALKRMSTNIIVQQEIRSHVQVPFDLFLEEVRRLREHLKEATHFRVFLEEVLQLDSDTLEPLDDVEEFGSPAVSFEPDRFNEVSLAFLIVAGMAKMEAYAQKLREFHQLCHLSDMTQPHTWYPEARSLKRRVVLHVGPTNSGKTHAALQSLMAARSGVYCGPLRLLAWEIHERLNTNQIPCDLVTGHEVVRVHIDEEGQVRPQGAYEILSEDNLEDLDRQGEQQIESSSEYETQDNANETTPLQFTTEHSSVSNTASDDAMSADEIESGENSSVFVGGDAGQQGAKRRKVRPAAHSACTVEMADTRRQLEVGVVDEVQLMTDTQRGQFFTRAVLGLACKELHLCGHPDAVPLVKRLCEKTQDNLEIKYYTRLAPLRVTDSLRGDWRRVRPGDCVVAFSRSRIFDVKAILDGLSGGLFKCAVVYGALPPELRKQQARAFNSGECSVLVASDAVGMGLNLQIRRVVFLTLSKFDGAERRPLHPNEILQIAGRAGRYGSQFEKGGEVTCFERSDMAQLQAAMALCPTPQNEPEEFENYGGHHGKVAVFPSPSQLETFCRSHESQPLHILLRKFCDLAKVSDAYFVANIEATAEVARLIHDVELAQKHQHPNSFVPLTLAERILLSLSPVEITDNLVQEMFIRYVTCLLEIKMDKQLEEDGVPLGMNGFLKAIQDTHDANLPEIQFDLEAVHKSASLYVWLAQRMPAMFRDDQSAEKAMKTCAERIHTALQVRAFNAHHPDLARTSSRHGRDRSTRTNK
eukprot:c16331_g1_i1.p1 GENE.c16331_g1_i1~~c16331_g1_i1.p1  ORF type:complete len:764 (-),score=156.79 c16331_g1_i1:12-2303(-)